MSQPGQAATAAWGSHIEPVICVLGDANLDVIVRLRGPVEMETDTPAATAVCAGGQAANVAAWITALGGRARLIAARAADPAGRLVTAELERRGVAVTGPVVGGRTGVVVSLSDSGRFRSMLTDRGAGPLLSAEALDQEWLAGCAWLHLPAYSLVSEPIQGAALAAAARLPRLSVDLSSTAALREYGVQRFRALLERLRPRVVFATEAEAGLAGDIGGCEMVVKLGPGGVRAGGKVYPAPPVQAVDSTGAGDAFAAGYLVGAVTRGGHGAGPVELGLLAAARAVATMGAMP